MIITFWLLQVLSFLMAHIFHKKNILTSANLYKTSFAKAIIACLFLGIIIDQVCTLFLHFQWVNVTKEYAAYFVAFFIFDVYFITNNKSQFQSPKLNIYSLYRFFRWAYICSVAIRIVLFMPIALGLIRPPVYNDRFNPTITFPKEDAYITKDRVIFDNLHLNCIHIYDDRFEVTCKLRFYTQKNRVYKKYLGEVNYCVNQIETSPVTKISPDSVYVDYGDFLMVRKEHSYEMYYPDFVNNKAAGPVSYKVDGIKKVIARE